MTPLLVCKVRDCKYNFTSLGVNYFERAIYKIPKKSMVIKNFNFFQERECLLVQGKDAGVKK